MKADIHPSDYRTVLFTDSASGASWLGKSTAKTRTTATHDDGEEYPTVMLGISNVSHPFYTGKQTFVDTAGRADKFRQRAAKTKAAQEAAAERKPAKKRR